MQNAVQQKIDTAMQPMIALHDSLSTTGQAGIDSMLKDHPGSAVTSEQLEAIDAQQSGSSESLVAEPVEACQHPKGWKQGMLPKGILLKICRVCAYSEQVTPEEWHRLA